METAKENEIYFIQGVNYRGKEVIDALKEKYGDVCGGSDSGNDPDILYYVDDSWIKKAGINSMMATLLYRTGTEIILPKQILPIDWENVSKLIDEKSLSKIERIETWGMKECATYAKLIEIRKLGTEYYGKFSFRASDTYYCITQSDFGGFSFEERKKWNTYTKSSNF